jgi:NADH-quinone oxidoreductase subunit N
MKPSLTPCLEYAVVLLGLGFLLLDLWTPAAQKRNLGYGAAVAVGVVLLLSFCDIFRSDVGQYAFNNSYVLDNLALFFKRLFMVAAILVLVLAVEFSDRIPAGISEYYSLILFALAGMMFAASANSFMMLFVSLELITITFYILTSFQSNRQGSLEAGVKYLILGALSSAFTVYGIALVYGTSGVMGFGELAARLESHPELTHAPLFITGFLMVMLGLTFKIAAFPMQVWAPDVYQGSPAPTTAFLAIGSKAAGVVLLLRLIGVAAFDMALRLNHLIILLSAVTILYGSLCAIPQRNLKRLMGYSSIANSGYMLLGFSALHALHHAATSAILFFLAGYLFAVIIVFTVIGVVIRESGGEDISALSGLGRRSPLLAASLTLSMVSLAGIPPLAGFIGKFLLFRAVVELAAQNPAYYWLLAVALVGVVISLYYYFGVIRAIYWGTDIADRASHGAIEVSTPIKISLAFCVIGMLYFGVLPNQGIQLALDATQTLKW